MHEILPGKLWIRGRTDNVLPLDKLATIEALGIDTIVNLWSRADPDLEKSPAIYVHYPIPDGVRIEPDLARLAMELAKDLRDGAKILIQCHAGRNRSGLLAAMVVRLYLNCTSFEAMRRVREGRPRAIANEAFEKYMMTLR
jgi:protein-tyrosine phosphatase